MDEETRKRRAPKSRLSQEKRERFLQVLGETGNRRVAAEAIGVEPRLMDQRREFDPLLDRQWREAMAQAQRRLAGADGPLDCIGGAEPMVVQRGPGGKLRAIRAGGKRWSRPVEERFFASLSMTGNLAASARSVGFTSSCIFQRRRKFPEFERRLQEALEDAELALEFRLAVGGGGFAGALAGEGERPSTLRQGSGQASSFDAAQDRLGSNGRAGQQQEFDADSAMRFLKWREEKRRGGGHRGRIPAGPSIEEVRDTVLTRIRAIRRHRERQQLAEGWSRDEEGRMIPPGWVRKEG